MFAAVVVLVLLLLFSLVFGVWAFSSRQDYKNNADKLVAAAVKKAEAATSAKKDAEFAEAQKSPLRTYTAPEEYGAIAISYPKTWSAYIDVKSGSSKPVDAYFSPDFVQAIAASNIYALRLQVLSNTYENELKTYDAFIKQGTLKAVAFTPKKVSGAAVGTRLDGSISTTKKGSVVLLKVRDKTVKIWTENTTYQADFEAVLDNLTYQP